MFVRALVYTYENKDALVIPSSAMKKKEQDYFVYVIHKEEPKEEKPEDKDKKKEKKKLSLFGAKKKEAPKEEAKPGAAEPAAEFGTVEIRTIKPGYTTQDLIEVSEGLTEGELIVTEVQEEFKDKARVEIAEVMEGLI